THARAFVRVGSGHGALRIADSQHVVLVERKWLTQRRKDRREEKHASVWLSAHSAPLREICFVFPAKSVLSAVCIMSDSSGSNGDLGRFSPVPFGLGKTKPKHYREMLRIAWENRDNLPYALRILKHGVCDGCS